MTQHSLSASAAVCWVRTLPHDQGLVFVTGCPAEGTWFAGATVFATRLWVVTKVNRYGGSPQPAWPNTEVVWCRPASAAETAAWTVPATQAA